MLPVLDADRGHLEASRLTDKPCYWRTRSLHDFNCHRCHYPQLRHSRDRSDLCQVPRSKVRDLARKQKHFKSNHYHVTVSAQITPVKALGRHKKNQSWRTLKQSLRQATVFSISSISPWRQFLPSTAEIEGMLPAPKAWADGRRHIATMRSTKTVLEYAMIASFFFMSS